MTFAEYMNESLRFVDLPELCQKWKNRFNIRLNDCATLSLNGMEVKFSASELANIYNIDIAEAKQFFDANGWSDCSPNKKQLIFRQSREPVDNIKPYVELELLNDPDKMEAYNRFIKELDFSKFYHISSATPEILKQTGGLRCKNKNNVKYERRIYMISGKMALKTIVIDGTIDYDTSIEEAQAALEKRLDELTERMLFDMHYTWRKDHDEDMPKMYVYEINLPSNFKVYKDPEFDDEDDLSACACFTNQNIPVKYIKLSWETK